MPVEKWIYTVTEADKEAEEVIHRPSVLLAGSSVVAGEGVAQVVSAGDSASSFPFACRERRITLTADWRLSTLRRHLHRVDRDGLASRRPLNAFEISIRRISYLLLGFMAVMTPVVFVIQGLVNKAAGWKVRHHPLEIAGCS